jgi:hypothetical protein
LERKVDIAEATPRVSIGATHSTIVPASPRWASVAIQIFVSRLRA